MQSAVLDLWTWKKAEFLGIRYSYNKHKKTNHKNWETPKAMETKKHNFFRGENYLKIFALSKITHLTTGTTSAPIHQLSKMQKDFISNKIKPKIKNSTLRNGLQDGGLKKLIVNQRLLVFNLRW